MTFEPSSRDMDVAEHYSQEALLESFERAVAEVGLSPETVALDDLAGADEFHIGGHGSTVQLCEQLGLTPDSLVLDIGSGIGGPARHIASTYGCKVTGLDLTPEYVLTAAALTEWTGLGEFVHFETGSALAMPFADDAFDVVTQIHVGMNIADKNALFAEVSRVLRRGGLFGVFDVMKASEAGHDFPVPWATGPEASFVLEASGYTDALTRAGLEIVSVRDRTTDALGFVTATLEAVAEVGPSPLSLGLVMGPDVQTKVMNLVGAIGAGALAPVEIVCRKP